MGECLNNFIKPPKREPDAPLRLPISNIYNIKGVGQIICGTIEQGTLRPGDVIGIVHSGLKGKKMFSIEQHKKVLESAGPGNSVGMSIKGISKDEKVNPGDIIYLEKEGELLPIKAFRHGCRPGAPWCPQGWLLSYHLLPYCQGCLQNDQDLVEAIEEDRKCQGRDASRAHPIRERRS